MRFLPIAVLLLCLAGCKNKQTEDVDGGPCTYTTTVKPALLLSFQRYDSFSYDAKFEVPNSATGKKDTIGYFELNQQAIPSDTIKSRQLKVGDTLQFVMSTIVTGCCRPEHDYFDLIPFR